MLFFSLVTQACKYGRVQHLEHLLFYGAEMDVRNSCGNTPLHVCALSNQEACTRVLLFRGADPSVLNYNNQTADQAAAMAGNSNIAKMITSHNLDDVGESSNLVVMFGKNKPNPSQANHLMIHEP